MKWNLDRNYNDMLWILYLQIGHLVNLYIYVFIIIILIIYLRDFFCNLIYEEINYKFEISSPAII